MKQLLEEKNERLGVGKVGEVLGNQADVLQREENRRRLRPRGFLEDYVDPKSARADRPVKRC